MKNMTPKNIKKNIRFNDKDHRPDNKNEIDSREGEEQLTKGDDVTHNVKERKILKGRKRIK